MSQQGEQLRLIYSKAKRKAQSMVKTSKQWTVRLLLISSGINLVLFLGLLYDPYQEYHVVEMNPPRWATSYAILVPEGSLHQPPIMMRPIPDSGLLLVPTELNASQASLRIRYGGRIEDGAHVEKTLEVTYQLSEETKLGEVWYP